MCGYQVWFFPIVWLYWPTKSRKKETRNRVLAVKSLAMTRFSGAIQRNRTLEDGQSPGEQGTN